MSLALLLCMGTGCHRHVYSPPARVLPLQSVAVLPQGETAFAVEGGAHSVPSGLGGLESARILSGVARLRHGFGRQWDGVLESSFMHVTGGNDVATKRDAFALYTGAKWAALERFLAFEAGLGGGASAAGGFLSPSLGWILGFENPYVVPFLAQRGFVSQPIAPNEIDIGASELQRTHRTYGVATTLGLRVPVRWHDREWGSIMAGLGATYVNDLRNSWTYPGFQFGLELRP